MTNVNGIQGTLLIQGGANTTVSQLGNSLTIATTSSSDGIKDLQSSDGSLIVTNPTGPISTISLAPNKINSGHIIDGTIQATDIAAGVIPNTANFIQTGATAGGDLSGTYPNPNLGNGKVTTNHILDGTIQATDLASGVIPNTANFIQNGTPAGGDLTGSYPNPTVGSNKITANHIADGTITPADISGAGANHNDALIYDVPMIGTPQWVIRKPVNVTAGAGINVTTASAGPSII